MSFNIDLSTLKGLNFVFFEYTSKLNQFRQNDNQKLSAFFRNGGRNTFVFFNLWKNTRVAQVALEGRMFESTDLNVLLQHMSYIHFTSITINLLINRTSLHDFECQC